MYSASVGRAPGGRRTRTRRRHATRRHIAAECAHGRAGRRSSDNAASSSASGLNCGMARDQQSPASHRASAPRAAKAAGYSAWNRPRATEYRTRNPGLLRPWRDRASGYRGSASKAESSTPIRAAVGTASRKISRRLISSSGHRGSRSRLRCRAIETAEGLDPGAAPSAPNMITGMASDAAMLAVIASPPTARITSGLRSARGRTR